MARTLTVDELVAELRQMPGYYRTDIEQVHQGTFEVTLVAPDDTRHL